jgi:TetR/AcrR family transcriptional regulator, transcriptional repressor for nem operon
MYRGCVTERQDDARERLIEGTRQLLWERGYVGTSPTAIWRASGVGQGSMYHHFRGKPDLVLAAEQRTAQEMQRQIRESFTREGAAYERISAYLLRERDALRGCPVGRLIADPEIAADEQLREPVRETFAVLHACLTSAIEDGKAWGEFDASLDAERTASALSAVIQGGYALARAEASAEPFDRAIQGALALLRMTMPASQ